MSAARKPTARPRGLVLVRGGLDGSHTGGGDGDWEDFCRRIGWQAPAHEPDDDFERRIQEGLLAIPRMPDVAVEGGGAASGDLTCPQSTSGVRLRPWLDEAEELGSEYGQSSVFESRQSGVHAALGVGAAAAADFGAVVAADRPREVGRSAPRRGLVRAGVAAAMLAVAAAAALAVTHLASAPAGSKAASIAAPTAEGARAAAANADEPAVEGRGLDAPLPLETGPVRATSAPSAEPAPGPTSPRVGPSAAPDAKVVPPGMRVARRSLDDGAIDIALTEERVAERVARQPLARELRQPFSHDVRQAFPSDVRQSLPHQDGLAKWGAPRGDLDAPSAEDRPVMASLDVAGRPGADPAAMRAAAVRSLVAQPAVGSAQRPAAGPAQRPAVVAAREPLPDVTLAAVDGGAAPSAGDGGDAWARVPAAARPAAPEGAGAANASWSLGGAKDRWVGASLAAPPPPLATSNIGVIVQLDLGKALGKL